MSIRSRRAARIERQAALRAPEAARRDFEQALEQIDDVVTNADTEQLAGAIRDLSAPKKPRPPRRSPSKREA